MNLSLNRIIYLVITALITTILFITYDKWKVLELKSYDYRFQIIEYLNIGRSKTSGKVVVVGIDEKSITKEKPALFINQEIGEFLEKMKEYNAAAIGIDIIPVHKNQEKFKNAVLTLYDSGIGKERENFLEDIGERLDMSLFEPLVKVSETTPVVQAFHGGIVPFYFGAAKFMKKIYLSDAVLTDGYSAQNDGVIRRQDIKFNGENVFSYTLYKLLKGREIEDGKIGLNYSLFKNIPYYCFEDVMADKAGKDNFSDKIIILGYMSRYEDLHPTPLNKVTISPCNSKEFQNSKGITNKRMPGVFIHAISAETLIGNTSIRELSLALQYVVLSFLILAGLSASIGLRPTYSIPAVLSIMALFFIINAAAFSKGYVIHLFPHILSPFMVLAFIYPYKYITEEGKKKKIYKIFSYYIDKEVLDTLIEKEPNSLLKSEYKDACIMFLDIRNFTMLSTLQDAENTVGFLNLFFGKTTEIIQSYKGFVNKFIGDGMLAFYITGENPTENAFLASEEIIKETERLNNEGKFKQFIGDWNIDIGIGIHYGKVLMGNIGSEKKMDFTIIGENVNMASRVEGLTKQVQKKLLLTETAYQMLKDKSKLGYAGEYDIKGFDKKVNIYAFSQ